MFNILLAVALAPVVVALYAYIGYPAILLAVTWKRRRRTQLASSFDWPSVTVTVPIYNAAPTVRATLERLLQVDYPRDRLQLLVLSDASTDGTDDIVRKFAARGVELIAAPERRGKTAAENAAFHRARGDIIVNIDATVSVRADSLKKLLRVFEDPTIGLASGRDVSVDSAFNEGSGGESSYTNYEMWLRDLETRVGSIVGASGCFYGIRRPIHSQPLATELSWDFASALVARQQGYRSVSVPDALVLVPRTARIGWERKRKARTMARGLSTLFHFRELMNPFAYGSFALMLVSHKLLRWLPYLLAPLALLALALLATQSIVAATVFGTIAMGILVGAGAIKYGDSIKFRPLALAGFAVAVASAGLLAWVDALRGTRMVTWDPTPRPGVTPV
jgi:cellulose synthase/poly-beta-1,6-N-acetylglucosamine synthase-like glycosyltransferase